MSLPCQSQSLRVLSTQELIKNTDYSFHQKSVEASKRELDELIKALLEREPLTKLLENNSTFANLTPQLKFGKRNMMTNEFDFLLQYQGEEEVEMSELFQMIQDSFHEVANRHSSTTFNMFSSKNNYFYLQKNDIICLEYISSFTENSFSEIYDKKFQEIRHLYKDLACEGINARNTILIAILNSKKSDVINKLPKNVKSLTPGHDCVSKKLEDKFLFAGTIEFNFDELWRDSLRLMQINIYRIKLNQKKRSQKLEELQDMVIALENKLKNFCATLRSRRRALRIHDKLVSFDHEDGNEDLNQIEGSLLTEENKREIIKKKNVPINKRGKKLRKPIKNLEILQSSRSKIYFQQRLKKLKNLNRFDFPKKNK